MEHLCHENRYFAKKSGMVSASLKISLSLLLLFLAVEVSAQEWNFIREKDGIKIYTRKEKGNSDRKSVV